MRIEAFFILIVIVLLLNEVSTQKKHKHIGAKKCANRQFRKDRVDRFGYVGVIENGIIGTTENVTRLKIVSNVVIGNWETCDFYLKVDNVKIYESLGSKDNYKELKSDDLSKRLSAHALRFTMKDGMVVLVSPSVKSTKADVLNMQRGILSMLQIRQAQNKEIIDDDVSGSCLTNYILHKNGHDDIVDDNVEHIDKIKDLNSCTGHLITHSNIYGNAHNEKSESGMPKDPVLKSSSVCSYKLNRKKRLGLKNVICKEKFLVQPFSSEAGAGAYVTSRTELTRTSSKKIKKQQIPYTNFYSTSIKYDHNHQHVTAHVPSFKLKVKKLLRNLAKDHYYKSNFDSAANFYDLVASLRHLNMQDMGEIVNTIDLKKESIRFFVFDAMAQCGTPSCAALLFKTMNKNNLHNEAFRFMPYLAFIKEPTPEVVRMLMNIHQQTKNPSVLLLLSSLVYRMCQHRREECDQTGIIGKVMEDTEYYFLQLLGDDCQTSDVSKQQNIFYALRGIGNIGRPSKAMPLIMDCIKHAKHTNMSVAAIQSVRRMTLSEETMETFLEMLTDKNEELEIRVEIFLILMKSPTRAHIILATDLANDEEESSQMRSFLTSYLRSVLKNQDPTKTKLTALFKSVLDDYPLSDFDPSPSRYSKAFLHSANLYRFAATADGMVLFHPESFVPRTVNLNLTTHMFGFSLNAFELNARMEGLEMLLGKYFGSSGYFSNKYADQLFKIPKEKLSTSRKRRSTDENNDYEEIDAEVNMKKSSPQALVSLKVFGNEIQMFTLQDLPFLNGRLDDMNMIKELYHLTKGKRKTFKQNMILVEASHSVPTILGLPLKIGVNGSAVTTLDVKGKVVTANLVFGPKKVVMHGSLQPSVSIHASAQLSVECIGVGKIGTSFQANVHAGRILHGRLEYEEGKELKVDLNADKAVTDILNITYNMYHMTSQKKQAIDGITKKTSGYFCTDDFLNSSILFGSNTCTEINFPNAYYNLSAPYFPLTGPFHFGIRNYPTDPLLKRYHMEIKKLGGLYAISVSTPGATDERKYTMSLGVTKRKDGGTVGVSFGQKRKGVVLNYNFKKETNGISATLSSNFTKMPLVLFARFFNETDPATLNRNVGGEFKFSFGKYYVKHVIFYKNTYEYWALGSNLEYGPGKVASLDLKIQYEPQAFFLNFIHAPTNTQVIAHASPSLPLLVGNLNITHGNDVDIRTFGKVDISKYEVAGHVFMRPGNKQLKASGKWIPKDKVLSFVGDVNGTPLTWDASLKKDLLQSNVIDSVIKISKSTLQNKIEWNNKKIFVSTSLNKFMSTLQSTFTRSTGKLNVDTEIYLNGDKTNFNFALKNTSKLHELCLTGNFMEMSKFGYCLKMHHEKQMKGFSLDVLLPEGNWIVPISFLQTTNETGSALTVEFMKLVSLALSESANRLRFNINAYGTMIDLQKSRGDYDATNLRIIYRNQTTNVETMNYFFGHEKSVTEDGLNVFKLNTVNGDRKISMEMVSKTEGLKFKHILNFMDEENQPYYSVILWNGNANYKPTSLAKNKIYIDWNPQLGKADSLEYEFGDIGKIKVSDIYEGNTRKIIVQAMPLSGENQNLKMEDVAVISMLSNGDITFKIMTENAVMKGLGAILNQYQSLVKANLYGMSSNVLMKYFGELLKLKPDQLQNVMQLCQKGAVEYIATLKCNGEDINKKYVKGKITTDMIIDIIIKTLELPFSQDFLTTYKNVTGIKNIDKITELLGSKNLLSFTSNLIQNQLDAVTPEKYMNLLPGKDLAVIKLDVFEKEFLIYLQKVVKIIQSSYSSELQNVRVKHQMSNITTHLPEGFKKRFISTIQTIVQVLRTWKYDLKKKPTENIELLMQKLKQAKIDELFQFDFLSVIGKSILAQSNIPNAVKGAMKGFLADSNYVKLMSQLSRFALQEFKVTGAHGKHIQQLLSSRSVLAYFTTLSNLINKRSRLGPKKKQAFMEFSKNRQLKPLFINLKKILEEKYQVSDIGMQVIDKFLFHEDFASLSVQGIPSLLEINFIPSLLKKILQNLKDGDIHQTLLKLINIANPDIDIDALKMVLSGDNSLEEMLMISYQSILKESNKHIPNGQKKYSKIIEDLVTKIMDVLLTKTGNKREVSVKAKRVVLFYYDTFVDKMKELLPTRWNKRLDAILKSSQTHLTKISPDTLKMNATNALKEVSKNILKDLSSFIPNKLVTYIEEETSQWIKQIASKINLEGGSLMDMYKRTMEKTDENLKFLIRLLGQFSESEKNPFAEKFLKDGKIQYYKIYQSVWQQQLLNNENTKQIKGLFSGLEKRAFEEIVKFTGDYSLIATTNNLFNYVKSLNYTDLNTIIDSYRNIDVNRFKNLSLSALKGHVKSLLEEIGAIKDGDQTINNHVYKALPKLIGATMKFSEFLNKGLSVHLEKISQGKAIIRQGFLMMKQYLKKAQNDENKFGKFMLDLLVPGIDGLIAFAEKQNKGLPDGMETLDRCAQTFVMQQTMYLNHALNDSTSIQHINNDNELKLLFKMYENSSECDLINFIDHVKEMKKDGNFVAKLLDKIEQIILKMIYEHRKEAEGYILAFKSISLGNNELLKGNSQNALQKIIFHAAERLASAIEKITAYKKYRRVIRRSISLENYDINTIFKKFLTKQLKKIQPMTSVDQVNKLGRKHIISTVQLIKKHTQNISLIILKSIDDLKRPLSKHKFITDPYGYAKSIPRTLIQLLQKNLKENDKKIMKNLYEVENKIRALFEKAVKMLNEHSDAPNKFLLKIKTSYKKATSKYFDEALSHIEKYNAEISKSMKNYALIDGKTNGVLKQKLNTLTKKTKEWRKKYMSLQKKFIGDLKKNMTLLLTGKRIEVLNKEILSGISKDKDTRAVKKAMSYLSKSLRDILSETLSPQLVILSSSIDKTVCDVKTYISRFYSNSNGIHIVSWKSPALVEGVKLYERKYYGLLKVMTNYTNHAQKYVQDIIVTKANFESMKRQHEQFIKQAMPKHLQNIELIVREKTSVIYTGHNLYSMYATQSPDHIVGTALSKYQDHIKKLALQVNKAVAITTPTDIEKPIIRFLGLEYKENKNKFLTPISRTAYIFKNSLVTFDGKAIFLPRDLHHKFSRCKYLLSRDFMWKNFTLYLHKGNFVVELQDGKVVIERYHKNKVHVYTKLPPSYQLKHVKEMPVQMMYTTVSKLPNVLKIQNVFGLLIYCKLDVFSCNVTVSGYYHNKTLGLLGTNNVEHSDDMRMPDGRLALSLTEFVNSYELTKEYRCEIDDPEDIFGSEEDDIEREHKMEKCNVTIHKMIGEKQSSDIMMRSSAFTSVCSVEDTCPVMLSYGSSVKTEGGLSNTLPLCEACTEKTTRIRLKKELVQITLLVKLTPKMLKVKDNIKQMIQKVEFDLKKSRRDIEFCIVGYSGSRMRLNPHIQTGGDGKVFMDGDTASGAIDRLIFDGTDIEQRVGFLALKFASLMESKRSIRLFMLFDNDASYTNSLQEMMDVYNIMNERSIVLNTVNSYKLLRNVIGKDSFGYRYHVRLAQGEQFNVIRFPPPDDYIPLVKNTGGAVFTLKAFTSSHTKWMKALPTSVSKAIELQVQREEKTCKECKCNVCKNVNPEYCDYGL